MTQKSAMYDTGFLNACSKAGLDKQASERLYKTAQWGQIFGGLGQAFRGLGSAAVGVGRAGYRGIEALNKGINYMVGPGSNALLGAHNRFAHSLERGALSHIPGVKAFGKGYARAQRQYARDMAAGRSSGLLTALLGVGKGTVLGNTLHGLGSFSARHPYIGALALATPVAALAAKLSKDNDERDKIDTMTPAQKRIYDRIFNESGYVRDGYDADDVSVFGAL